VLDELGRSDFDRLLAMYCVFDLRVPNGVDIMSEPLENGSVGLWCSLPSR